MNNLVCIVCFSVLLFSVNSIFAETVADVKRRVLGNTYQEQNNFPNNPNYSNQISEIQNIRGQKSTNPLDNPTLRGTATEKALKESGFGDYSLYSGNSNSSIDEEPIIAGVIYKYDSRGRRVVVDERGIGGKYRKIFYSAGVSVMEEIYEDPNSEPIDTLLYHRGSDMGGGVGGILYTTDKNGNNPIYYHYNQRGDVIKKTDENGAIVFLAKYDAFGQCTEILVNSNDKSRQRANTKEQDSYTGLINDGHRYRNPETGRFLTPDPLEYVDGLNPYIYCGQNPWGRFDALGLKFAFRGTDKDNSLIKSQLLKISLINPNQGLEILSLWYSEKTHTFITPRTNSETRALYKSKGAHVISVDSDNAINGIGTDTFILLDPQNNFEIYHGKDGNYFTGVQKSTEVKKKSRLVFDLTPEETMAHEITHSKQMNDGKFNNDIAEGKNHEISEEGAMRFERRVSRFYNRVERMHHDVVNEDEHRNAEQQPNMQNSGGEDD